MFNANDKIHFKNLVDAILTKTKLNDLDCRDISKIYRAFEWLQTLDEKIDSAIELQLVNQDLKEALNKENNHLVDEIKALEEEVEKLRKSKTKKIKKEKK